MSELDEVCKRLDRRDGYRVVSYREVGLPLFRISCALTLQETTPLGPIEEFTLKSISKGIDTVSDIERFLGLPYRVVVSQLGNLAYEGAIAERGTNPISYAVTAEGLRRLAVASASTLVRQRIPLYADGLTRRLVPVDPSELWTGKSLDAEGVSLVTPTPPRRPHAAEIDLAEVNRVTALMAKVGRPTLRAVRLDSVVGKPSLVFRRALAVAFKSTDGRRMVITFAIDGRQSDEHEIEYERSGAAARSMLFSTLLDPDKRRRGAQAAARELRRDVEIRTEPAAGAKPKRPPLSLTPPPAIAVASANVRVLSVYDHPPLLRDALAQAAKRLLIVSPWIRANVVNPAFIKQLTACLDRGVEVTIGYGISRNDRSEREPDRAARESLEALTKAFGNFRLIRKGNTHAKILLVDDSYFVTTSFNWLSFSGDPNQPMREEEGTLVEHKAAVDDYYQSQLAKLLPQATA